MARSARTQVILIPLMARASWLRGFTPWVLRLVIRISQQDNVQVFTKSLLFYQLNWSRCSGEMFCPIRGNLFGCRDSASGRGGTVAPR